MLEFLSLVMTWQEQICQYRKPRMQFRMIFTSALSPRKKTPDYM